MVLGLVMLFAYVYRPPSSTNSSQNPSAPPATRGNSSDPLAWEKEIVKNNPYFGTIGAFLYIEGLRPDSYWPLVEPEGDVDSINVGKRKFAFFIYGEGGGDTRLYSIVQCSEFPNGSLHLRDCKDFPSITKKVVSDDKEVYFFLTPNAPLETGERYALHISRFFEGSKARAPMIMP